MGTSSEFEVKYVKNDTKPDIRCTYKDVNGNPIDISGYGVELHIDYKLGPKIITGSIVDGPNGIFKFVFSPGDIDEVGIFNAEIQITDIGTGIITYQFIKFNINEEIA